MAIPVDIADPLERVKAWWATLDTMGVERVSAPGERTWDTPLHPNLTPITATVHTLPSPILSTTTFLLTVPLSLCNRLHNLHGGAAATIFDLCTTIALVPLAKEGFWQWGGVSRGLSVTYLKPVPEGMTVLVGCEVVSLGKRLAVIKGWMREWDVEKNEVKGPVLTLCEHGKVDIGGLPVKVKL